MKFCNFMNNSGYLYKSYIFMEIEKIYSDKYPALKSTDFKIFTGLRIMYCNLLRLSLILEQSNP